MCRLRTTECINCHDSELVVERACTHRDNPALCDRGTVILPDITILDCGCADTSFFRDQVAIEDVLLAQRLQEDNWLSDPAELTMQQATTDAVLAQQLQDDEDTLLADAQQIQDTEDASLADLAATERQARAAQLEHDSTFARAMADAEHQALAIHPPAAAVPPVHRPIATQPGPANRPTAVLLPALQVPQPPQLVVLQPYIFHAPPQPINPQPVIATQNSDDEWDPVALVATQRRWERRHRVI